jgi:2-methylcitrate synthase/citrate synthase II
MTQDAPEIRKGLVGVVADTTSISKVDPEINSLIYRGYPVQDLAEKRDFMDVAHLMWRSELPDENAKTAFVELEKSHRALSDDLKKSIKLYPRSAHPMDVLRTGISYLGMEDPDIWGNTPEVNELKAMKMMAKIPSIIAMAFRLRKGEPVIDPDSSLGFTENFLNMCFGKVPDADVIKAFDVSLILYAEHSFNASTFTGRVVTSTMSDIYSAASAAVGALKGPLHGGANEAVMYMLQEVDKPENAKQWMLDALAQKKKIMGFGHRVYKKGDSRAPTMQKYGLKMAEYTGITKWHDISKILEETMIAEKNIYPNLDFPCAPAYYLMGFDIDLFTPIFVMSRISGWCAHFMEQTASNALIRPLSAYNGPAPRQVP